MILSHFKTTNMETALHSTLVKMAQEVWYQLQSQDLHMVLPVLSVSCALHSCDRINSPLVSLSRFETLCDSTARRVGSRSLIMLRVCYFCAVL